MKDDISKNICYATNENFVFPVIISIVSLLENNKDSKLVINIVYTNLTKNSIQKFCSLEGLYENVKIRFHKIDENRFKDIKLSIPYISSETYFRFILPEILPNVDKILYLDGDTIINGNLSELFQIDISEYFCAGVRDIFIESIGHKQTLGIDGLYINAGVILFNLNKMRNSLVVENLFRITKEKSLPFQDQDAINIVFDNQIKELDCIYNFKRAHQKLYPQKVKDAKIIHFVGPNKPWERFSFNKLKRTFYKYKRIYDQRKKIKVCLLVDEYWGEWKTAFGGYGFLAKEIVAKNLPCDDIELEVIIGKQKNNLFWASSKIIDGIKVWRLPRIEFLMRRWLKKSKYDCWFSIECCYDYVLRLDPNVNRKLLLWIQDPRPLSTWAKINEMKKYKDFVYYNQSCYDTVKKWNDTRSVKFITQGETLSPLARKLYSIPKNVEISLLSNPIDIDFEYDFSLSKKEKIVVFLGRLEVQKRAWIFCEIAKLMPEYHFYVIGDFHRDYKTNKESLQPYLDDKIDNLHFCGRLVGEDKINLLKRARVLVNTSIWEGIPISWLEALSYGTVIVSSFEREHLIERFGKYVGEINGEGIGSAQLFIPYIKEFLENDSVYEQTAKNAISHIRKYHNVEKFKNDVRNIIRNFCK